MSLVVNHNLMAANTARNLNAHYGQLATSTQRLSSGLRINSASDDAAGLAIRELMWADVAALNQGVRNANDAISMIQVVDGALGIIDEKLIRMKELAEQAATGTYDSTQRLMIDSEFQAMASEIDRIAHATDFNGIHLLDGSLNGTHDGSTLNATGAMKIHFGSANDSAEDYYYVSIGAATVEGLGLTDSIPSTKTTTQPLFPIQSQEALNTVNGTITYNMTLKEADNSFIGYVYMSTTLENGKLVEHRAFDQDGFEIDADDFMHDYFTGAKNIKLQYKDQVGKFTQTIYDIGEESCICYNRYTDTGTGNFIELEMQFQSHITSPSIEEEFRYNNIQSVKSMEVSGNEIKFTLWDDPDNVRTMTYDDVSFRTLRDHGTYANLTYTTTEESEDSVYADIRTQEKAQKMLVRIDDAIIKKDQIRAYCGAMQNRLENTVSNLIIQAKNLQASESRISDIDVATEMTNFVRNQILAQSAVAMLSQANSMPQMAMQLIGG